MTRTILVALCAFFIGATSTGCGGEPNDQDDGVEEVGQSEQALNCVGQCVQIWRACKASGEELAVCNADREACKDDCDAHTCEPQDPGCCQGQPTCW